MRKQAQWAIAIASICAASMATAQAADIPAKRPAPAAVPVAAVVAVYDWTGFYLGLHGGGGWALSAWTDVSPPLPSQYEGEGTSSGWLGGGQLGYNFQAGAWVYGVEAQGSFANITGSRPSAAFRGLQNRSDIDMLGTLAGRVGLAQNNLLWFVKGGGAWADSDFDISGRLRAQWNQSRAGWLLGGGAEYGLTANWSIKVEYNYIDFGSETTKAIGCGSGCGFSEQVEQHVHVVMGGFNYRFPVR